MTTNPTPGGDRPVPPGPGDAETVVEARLRALSQTYSELPTAVADRLERALAELPDLTAPDTAGDTAPPPRQPWWRRRLVLATGTLAVVAVLGGGILIGAQPWSASTDSPADTEAGAQQDSGVEPFDTPRDDTDKDGAAPESEPGASSGQDESGGGTAKSAYPVTYSGRDYNSASLLSARDVADKGERSGVPGELATLADDAKTRQGCLSAIRDSHAGTVESVDFGRFESVPAMVAVVANGDGGVVVAVSSSCRAQAAGIVGTAAY